MPDQNAKIQSMTLTTETTQLGDECVNRKPPRITASRSDADIVRLTNGNPQGSAKTITVSLQPSDSIKLLFDPVPPMSKALNPGESLDWKIKAAIPGSAGVRFRTKPDGCHGHDQDDVIIHC